MFYRKSPQTEFKKPHNTKSADNIHVLNHNRNHIQAYLIIWLISSCMLKQGANRCRDMMITRVCSLWKARNRCTNPHPSWRHFMKRNCRLTCGLCSEDRFEGANQCRDLIPTRACSLWKVRDRCTNPQPAWRHFMKRNCRLTCGLCSDDRFGLLRQTTTTTNKLPLLIDLEIQQQLIAFTPNLRG